MNRFEAQAALDRAFKVEAEDPQIAMGVHDLKLLRRTQRKVQKAEFKAAAQERSSREMRIRESAAQRELDEMFGAADTSERTTGEISRLVDQLI